jgi:hypothetical protein
LAPIPGAEETAIHLAINAVVPTTNIAFIVVTAFEEGISDCELDIVVPLFWSDDQPVFKFTVHV